MPHILLRTSASLVENVDIGEILGELVRVLAEFETIDSRSIKAYHEMHTNWEMGSGAQAGFAYVQLSIASGRERGLIDRISDAMYSTMKSCFSQSIVENEANLTFEIREFDIQNYRKEP